MSSTAAVGPVPFDHQAPRHAPSLFELGRLLAEQGEHADAVLALQRRLRLAPHDLEARRLLAVSLLRVGEVDRAATLLEAAGRTHGLDPATCLELGTALLGDDPGRARGWILVAVRARPDDATARMRLEEADAVLAGERRRVGRHRRRHVLSRLRRRA